MYSMKRIMVATDMSLLARRAEVRAAMMVRELNCEPLDVLHIEDPSAFESLHNLTRSYEESTGKKIAETARTLHEHYGIAVTTTTVDAGRVHTAIVRHAKLIEARLVVLGAHGG